MRIAVVAFLGLPCTGVITPGPAPEPPASDSATPGIPALWSGCEALDPVVVKAAAQVGDEFEIEVEYAGGCVEDHRFSICRDGSSFAESEPVQTGALVWHDAAGDACEALITEIVRFDLAALYDAYDQAYGAPGQVVVNLDGVSVTVDVPAP